MLFRNLAGGASSRFGLGNLSWGQSLNVDQPVTLPLLTLLLIGSTAALGIVAVILQARPDVTAARALPWYAWVGGLYGAIFVVAAAWGVPRLGVALTITLMVAGQLLIGVVLDHFGAFGTPQHPISWGRVAGVAMVLAGVLLVRRS